ncbi:hypothetical protein HDE_11257 [Halotydeus destructor]|nr:hypothetical protein HDE_11257 [Halotydeus destructor]
MANPKPVRTLDDVRRMLLATKPKPSESQVAARNEQCIRQAAQNVTNVIGSCTEFGRANNTTSTDNSLPIRAGQRLGARTASPLVRVMPKEVNQSVNLMPLTGSIEAAEMSKTPIRVLYRHPKPRKHNPWTGDAVLIYDPIGQSSLTDENTKRHLASGTLTDFARLMSEKIVDFCEYEIQLN